MCNSQIYLFILKFNFYKNKKTETVKLGYRFIFQSGSKTLSDEEINKKVNKIIPELKKKL